jgi:serralysin
VVRGNAGANVLNGGDGNDELTGLGGEDLFLFNTPLDATFNVDTITDFNVADDTIRLDATIFSSGLTSNNSVASSQFIVGTAALDANHRIIYDNASGDVFYDSDGTGPTAAIRFARLSAGLSDPTDLDPLTNFDFFVIA